jgi:heme A synthase
MDAQTVSQINQMMERSQREVAANAQVVGYITIILAIVAAVAFTWLIVSAWRREQHARAERRVLDRLAQAEDPEGWARRQARQA